MDKKASVIAVTRNGYRAPGGLMGLSVVPGKKELVLR